METKQTDQIFPPSEDRLSGGGEEQKGTFGVLLLNLGGPDSLSAVRPFLYNLFSDREIIRLGPSFLQKPIAWLIASLRAGKTANAYGLIGGKSPIREMTFAQATALEDRLNESGPAGPRFKVYVGMRYWHPYIEDTIRLMHRDGVRRIIALGLYPQYSVATTGSSVRSLMETIERTYGQDISEFRAADPRSSFAVRGNPFTVFGIASWHDHPLYLDALAENLQKGIDSFRAELRTMQAEPDIHLLFSAHSLPVKFIEEGDPYDRQIRETVTAVAGRFQLPWDLSYQSKSGPVQWLEPSTEGMIEVLSRRGTKNILMVPVSFVSDHIETLFEIDILYKNMAESLGMRLRRTASLNTHPLFIAVLRDLVLRAVKEGPWHA